MKRARPSSTSSQFTTSPAQWNVYWGTRGATMTKLLALIDGSIYSQSICDYTAWIALRTSASVELLHVLGRRDVSSAPADFSGNLDVDARDVLLAELASLDEQKAKLSQKRGRAILIEAKARLVAAGVPNVSAKLRNGDLIETVNE